MRILLLGKDGQVGWELQRALAPLGDVTGLGRSEADLSQPDSLPAIVAHHEPDVIVNAAAYTLVDKAEDEPQLAATINTTAVEQLARTAVEQGALLVHYSTDYVFGDDGGDSPHRERDPTSPLGAYGRTKRDGERVIAASGCRHLIFRTSWVYAARGTNFLRTILKLAAERDSLRVVADQHGAPTGARLIADMTATAVRAAAKGAAPSGIYHLAAAGVTNWFDYARFIVSRARAMGADLKCWEESIVPVTTADYGAKAVRPLNSRLDTGKFTTTFGVELPPWQAGVDQALSGIIEGRA